MSNEEFRRRLNSVFDDVSGSPSSNLPDRVRAAVANPPEARGPYWLAAVAAVVIAVLVVGVLYIAGPLKPPSTVGGVHSTPTPSAAASPSPSPSPSATASVQPFVCTGQDLTSSAPTQPVVFITDLRTGTHAGYDRLTIQLTEDPSSVSVSVQSGTTFTLSPSGMQATLKGKNSVLVVIHGADLHSRYSGPIDFVTGYAGLAEVRRVEDFEGTVQMGLGVNGAACYHAYYLTNPSRLVIDVQNS